MQAFVATIHSAAALQRTVEPELMDDAAQAAAYGAADFDASDQAYVDRLVELFPGGVGGQLVDLGCGPGNISFRLASHFPGASVWGLDGAAAMLAIAHGRLGQLPGEVGRIRFLQVLLPLGQLPLGQLPLGQLPLGQLPETQLARCFSAVLSNSLLHHLHNPQVLWQSACQLGAPGAAIYIRDLRRPESPEAARALLAQHLGMAPAVLQHDYLASLHAAFTPSEVKQQLEQAGLAAQLQVAPLHDRYLEVWGRLPA